MWLLRCRMQRRYGICRTGFKTFVVNCGNCECIATWGRPSHASPFPALITTPCQVWRRWTYPLPYYSVFAADTLLYTVNFTSDPVTLTFDLWPSIFAAYCLWRDETVPNNVIKQSAAELLRFQCLTLWPWTCFKCCARLWGNFHQVWPSTTYLCLNYNVFYAGTLCQAVTLTFDLLTLKIRGTSSVTWSKSVRNLSEIKQFPAELLIILRIFAHVMSRCDLDYWPLDLELL